LPLGGLYAGFPLQSFGCAKRIYAAIPGATQGLPVILHGKIWCTRAGYNNPAIAARLRCNQASCFSVCRVLVTFTAISGRDFLSQTFGLGEKVP
ncbi:MAG: hypothetical protein LBQ57_09180, partial [Spirochaetales bacterium]|nr:hypothetical protein [Spirochaetales bacterium]